MKRFCITAVAALLCAAVCITCVALDVNKAKTAVELKENIYNSLLKKNCCKSLWSL